MKLCAIGYPLLDMVVNVDNQLLRKYNLKLDQVCEAEPWQLPLFQDILQLPVQYKPGGSTLNTCRVLQKYRLDSVTFMGCMGRDKFAEILECQLKSSGVKLCCQYEQKEANGVTAALVMGKYRTICASLGASKKFHLNHLLENREILENSDILYLEGFLVDHCFDCVLYLGHFAKEKGKVFTMNVSATYLCDQWSERLRQMIGFSHILFGNSDEFRALAEKLGLETTSLEQIALTLSQITEEFQSESKAESADAAIAVESRAVANTNSNQPVKSRVVIITNSNQPVIAASNGQVFRFPVPSVPEDQIADTIGAGDAFVGGFLAYYMDGKSLEHCIRFGIEVAIECIQKTGAQ